MRDFDFGPIMTIKQVADRLGVSERLVRRMIERGQFPRPMPVGGAERWCQLDVDSVLWLASRGLPILNDPTVPDDDPTEA